jgi:hypothetical protein
MVGMGWELVILDLLGWMQGGVKGGRGSTLKDVWKVNMWCGKRWRERKWLEGTKVDSVF